MGEDRFDDADSLVETIGARIDPPGVSRHHHDAPPPPYRPNWWDRLMLWIFGPDNGYGGGD